MVVVDPPLGWDIVLLIICSTHALLYILCAINNSDCLLSQITFILNQGLRV